MRILIGVLLLMLTAHAGDLWLPGIFSENMVLQRQRPIPVWGRAAPKAAVTVTLYDGGNVLGKADATAGEDGRWRLALPPQEAGGRYSLLVSAGPELRLFTNVLIGEVWVICGQSNMIWPITDSAEAPDAIARRNDYPDLRVVLIGQRNPQNCTEPQEESQGFWGPLKWEDSSYTVPRSSKTDIPGSSSAVSYYFARELYDYLGGKVPVGMLEVGAIMRVESWVDPETIAATPELAALAGKPYPHATSRCFLANIAPLAPYAVRGAIYYQGEMNAGNARQYRYGLGALITSWRHAWGEPDLPFLVVQLPGFIKHQAHEANRLDMAPAELARFAGNTPDHGFVGIREAQRQVCETVPGTGLAVTIDLGEPFNIHPPRKLPVGQRLFLQARRLVYGDAACLADGPTVKRVTFDGATCRIDFDHVGDGLRFAPAAGATSFELRTADGAWHAAAVTVDGPFRLIVSAPDAGPVEAVRYAWRGYPPVTLFNSASLPASPFIHPAIDFSQE